jgi:hypothetical protein
MGPPDSQCALTPFQVRWEATFQNRHLAPMIEDATAWLNELATEMVVARERCQWGKLDRLNEESRHLDLGLLRLKAEQIRRGDLPERGVLIDDQYLEDEESASRERHAKIVERYGSEEAYEQHCLAETQRARASRRAYVWRTRLHATACMHSRASTITGRQRPAKARPRGRRERHVARSSSGSDPGGDDGAGELAGAGFALLHALTPGLPGHLRLRLFQHLPQRLQDACWRDLATTVDANRGQVAR